MSGLVAGVYITHPDNEAKDVIHRAYYRQGMVYKSQPAYEADNDPVCYIPELSDSLYRKSDLLAMCNNQKEIADMMFEALDWQHPETWLDEQFREGELHQCDKCGKIYESYKRSQCPYCQKDEENYWYIERWSDSDLEAALEECGIPVSDENIGKLRDACKGIFDDKSDRNEAIAWKAAEIFEREER